MTKSAVIMLFAHAVISPTAAAHLTKVVIDRPARGWQEGPTYWKLILLSRFELRLKFANEASSSLCESLSSALYFNS